MQPTVDQDTLARLLARGRAQGHLTTEDLRRALPVEAMQAEDLALVVAHLEEEGVPVELDESLFLGGPAPDAVAADPELRRPAAARGASTAARRHQPGVRAGRGTRCAARG